MEEVNKADNLISFIFNAIFAAFFEVIMEFVYEFINGLLIDLLFKGFLASEHEIEDAAVRPNIAFVCVLNAASSLRSTPLSNASLSAD